jgi:hypothetical protein
LVVSAMDSIVISEKIQLGPSILLTEHQLCRMKINLAFF